MSRYQMLVQVAVQVDAPDEADAGARVMEALGFNRHYGREYRPHTGSIHVGGHRLDINMSAAMAQARMIHEIEEE